MRVDLLTENYLRSTECKRLAVQLGNDKNFPFFVTAIQQPRFRELVDTLDLSESNISGANLTNLLNLTEKHPC
jgi:hypothetical protein